MNAPEHSKNRAWAFEALDELQAYLADPDFDGDAEQELATIEPKRQELRAHKYRVVVLGAFNVGKSALVNAFLGDEYLPTVLEECTTKTTHVFKADAMRAVLCATSRAPEDEIAALRGLIGACNLDAAVETSDDSDLVTIAFASRAARDMAKCLRPLVTMSADTDFPQLRTLRSRFDEIIVHLPVDELEEDIALVDSPGVHSICETNQRIAQEIIPNSHLVLCLVDSQYAGNLHNREFIETIAKHRHRKVFFVINKCDQLNAAEIDPRGHSGPSRDLIRSLEGIVEDPEIYFVSALYALVSAQLSEGQLALSDIEYNNKIKIPWAVQRELLDVEEPTKGVADYLLEQSNIAELKVRLLDYLYRENRDGAVLESVCRFLDGKTWTYARPLQIKLEMARDIPRLDELAREHERLVRELDDTRSTAKQVLYAFNTMSGGGQMEGSDYAGYEAMVERLINAEAVEQNVLIPTRDWLADAQNLKKARKASYAPLLGEVRNRLDAFLEGALAEANQEVGTVERRTLEKTGPLRNEVEVGNIGIIEATPSGLPAMQVSLGGSYFAFLLGGLILGAGAGIIAGGAATTGTPEGVILGTAAGSGAGALLGLIFRGMSANGVRRKRLNKMIAGKIDQILLHEVRDQLKGALKVRCTTFSESIHATFGRVVETLNRQIAAVAEEEEDLLRKQQETIARLEPKMERMLELGRMAHDIVEPNAQ